LRPSDLEAAAESYGSTDLVIKPAVSAGADGAHRLRPSDNLPAALAGRRAMIQPFVASIADEGEYSLILFDGALSHSVIKRPRRGDFRVQPHLGGVTEPCAAPDGGEALAKAALAAAPAATSYARVDMIRGDDGQRQIMELELVEPALFLDLAPAAGAAFTRSILAAAERAGEQPLADGRGQVRRPAGIQPG
jgi:glutathione synthase/RimK-type ligase-like ATP-grasp enzyme